MISNKERVRKQLRENRSNLDAQEVAEKSIIIQQFLIDLDEFQKAETIHCYSSITKFNEIETNIIIDECLKSGKKLVMPVVAPESNLLIHRRVNGSYSLVPNKWGVWEPVEGEEVNPTEIDLVVVPMVGADRQKNRMGYGKGYYDRFLGQTEAVKVGLVFECCLIEWLPVEPHDILMDIIISEIGLIN